ncbi:hypothetical protein BRD17_07380 [Halobacteriales archaeon SW_7_68_16]|nr:MAG: hypothetical protein BRD17_07380 [Halobacteriales archaeon SW_7_68_16]
MTIDEARERIDEIDARIADDVRDRMDAVAEIAARKDREGRDVRDPDREAAVVDAFARRFRERDLSPERDRDLARVLIFTHLAAERHYDGAELRFESTIGAAIDAPTERTLVPIENSLGGGVTDTIDHLRNHAVRVTGEVVLPVEHALIAREDRIEAIERVRSHPQALEQCRDLIDRHGWTTDTAPSTAAAVAHLGPGEAAFAAEIAAEVVDADVTVLATGVQDTDTNVTRFLALGGESDRERRTAMILEPRENRPGLLHAMLSCFAGYGIDLTHIQSRPTRDGLGEYFFYVELAASGVAVDRAGRCLETYGTVQRLGGYDRTSYVDH